MRYLHCADIHLGYQQYNLKARFNDFGRAFYAVVDQAIEQEVDFVILAGDLFHKRSIDALSLNQAMHGLARLRKANIPCIAVEGNHERSYYEETIGWMKFLALQELLILLDAEFADHKAQLRAWDSKKRQGSYIDLPGGVRVHGMRYYGSGTVLAVQTYADALAQLEAPPARYNIFVAHAGVEGQLDEKAGGLSLRQWSPLRPHIDYVALGHFHKPFQLEQWIYNPGSPENCSVSENEWPDRGYLLVDLDLDAAEPAIRQRVVQGRNCRRCFRQLSFKTDHVQSPAELLERLEATLLRKAAELADQAAQDERRAREEQLRYEQGDGNTPRPPDLMPPVIELYLTGVLPFERSALDLRAIEELVGRCFQPAPLAVLVKNLTVGADFAMTDDLTLSRAVLEQQVLTDLFGRDARYAGHGDQWARLAINLKQLALNGAPAEAILDELAAEVEIITHADSAS